MKKDIHFYLKWARSIDPNYDGMDSTYKLKLIRLLEQCPDIFACETPEEAWKLLNTPPQEME